MESTNLNLFSFINSKIPLINLLGRYYKFHGIAEIVEDYLPYGKGCFIKKCPLNKNCRRNKKPSFAINNDKNIFYCFTCHKGGDQCAYICATNECSPIDAAKLLAKDFNLDITKYLEDLGVTND
jgi:DNA primase